MKMAPEGGRRRLATWDRRLGGFYPKYRNERLARQVPYCVLDSLDELVYSLTGDAEQFGRSDDRAFGMRVVRHK